MNTLLLSTLIIGISIAASWDLKTRKIPNLLTYSMMVIGLAIHGFNEGWTGIGVSGLGLIVGTAIFIAPYLMGGMGAGDAKLMGGIGAVLGSKSVIIVAILSVLSGLVYAVILLIIHHDYARSFLKRCWMTLKLFFFTRQWVSISSDREVEQPILCYAIPIAIGTLCTVLLKVTGSDLIQQVLKVEFSI